MFRNYFTEGFTGAGFDRTTWNTLKNRKAEDEKPTLPRDVSWLPEDRRSTVDPIITYYPPFDKCDRIRDYQTVWEYFDRQDQTAKGARS